MGWDWVRGQEESLDVIVQCTFSFSSWQNEDNHLNSIVHLLLQLLDPSVTSHTWFDWVDGGFSVFVTNLIKTLFHGALELVSDLGVSISVEDTPGLEGRLSKHFGLDLSINLSGVLFDVELVWCTASGGSHNQVSSIIFVALDLSRSLLEFQMPLLLLLSAFLVGCEGFEEIFAFIYFLLSVGVDNLGEIFHQTEVGSHGVCQSGELAEFWDESDLVSSLPVFVDEERLVEICNVLVVPSLVVVFVADLGSLLIERSLRRHSEVDSFYSVCLLVVSSDDSATHHGSRDCFLPISSSPFGLVSEGREIVQG